MSALYFIPSSLREAGQTLRIGLQSPVANLSKREFVNTWSSIAYLFPGLHPDGFDDIDSGWPCVLKCFAADAWRRAEAEELDEQELYASDAQWAGIYDRMTEHTEAESVRRKEIARLT